MDQFFILVVDDVDPDVRELMHLSVKKHASDWWHTLPNVWVVKSDKSVSWWQDRLEILFGLSGSFLVMALPENLTERKVGYYLRAKTTGAANWLNAVYREDPWADVPDPWGEKPALQSAQDDDEPPF